MRLPARTCACACASLCILTYAFARSCCAAKDWNRDATRSEFLLKKNLEYILRNRSDWCIIVHSGDHPLCESHFQAMLKFEQPPLPDEEDDDEPEDDEEDDQVLVCLCSLVRFLHAHVHARRHTGHVHRVRHVNLLRAMWFWQVTLGVSAGREVDEVEQELRERYAHSSLVISYLSRSNNTVHAEEYKERLALMYEAPTQADVTQVQLEERLQILLQKNADVEHDPTPPPPAAAGAFGPYTRGGDRRESMVANASGGKRAEAAEADAAEADAADAADAEAAAEAEDAAEAEEAEKAEEAEEAEEAEQEEAEEEAEEAEAEAE